MDLTIEDLKGCSIILVRCAALKKGFKISAGNDLNRVVVVDRVEINFQGSATIFTKDGDKVNYGGHVMFVYSHKENCFEEMDPEHFEPIEESINKVYRRTNRQHWSGPSVYKW